MRRGYFTKIVIAALTVAAVGFMGMPVRTEASEMPSAEMPAGTEASEIPSAEMPAGTEASEIPSAEMSAGTEASEMPSVEISAGTEASEIPYAEIQPSEAGDTLDNPIAITVGEDVAVMADQGKYYSFEILEPGLYVLEGSMRRFDFFIYDSGQNTIVQGGGVSPFGITCSGEVIDFSTAGIYFVYFNGMDEGGTFNIQKADIPSILVGEDVSAETRANHVLFYQFTPEEAGNYEFTFTLASGGGTAERVGSRMSVSYGSASASHVYDKMEAGKTYYFMLRNDTSTTVTVHAEKIPGLVSLSAAAPVRSVFYLGLDGGDFAGACQYQLTLDNGDVITTSDSDPEMSSKYNLGSKLYTIDGEKLPDYSHPSQAGEYYTVLTAEDLESEPVYFTVKDPGDCDLVLRTGETISGLKPCGMGNSAETHLIRVVLEEAGKYYLETSGQRGGINVYNSDLKYDNSQIGAGDGVIIETGGPAVYYAYAGAEDQFDISLNKLAALTELKISEDYRAVYINKVGDASLRLRGMVFCKELNLEGRTDANESIDFSYGNNNLEKYGIYCDIYNVNDQEKPLDMDHIMELYLPVGNYILRFYDREKRVSCDAEISVIDYQDIPDILTLGQVVQQTYRGQHYQLDIAESGSYSFNVDDAAADCGADIYIYDSDFERIDLEGNEKFSLDAGHYYVSIRKNDAITPITFTLKECNAPSEAAIDEVRNLINMITSQETAAEEALDKIVSAVETEMIRSAMQLDADVRTQIHRLEQQYIAEKSITVTEPVVSTDAMDKNEISMLGAGLNAESGIVTLSVSDASQDVTIPSDSYENEMALDIKLLQDGIEVNTLKIPVTVTMPVPAALSSERLAILHYLEDGSIEEIIHPSILSEGSFSFTVSHFSTFVLVNEKDAGGSEDGRKSLTGGIKCSGSGTDPVTIRLIGQDGAVAAQTAVTAGESDYTLDRIPSGSYTLQVSRPAHVTRDYAVTVESQPVKLDVEIWLMGDVNGDGRIDAKDKRIIFNHMAKPMLDGYESAVGDVNGDGRIDARDKRLIYNHINGTALLW